MRFEPVKREHGGDFLKRINDSLELLEPVKPCVAKSCSSETWYYKCGSCGHPIDPGDKFCRECGRAMKWE